MSVFKEGKGKETRGGKKKKEFRGDERKKEGGGKGITDRRTRGKGDKNYPLIINIEKKRTGEIRKPRKKKRTAKKKRKQGPKDTEKWKKEKKKRKKGASQEKGVGGPGLHRKRGKEGEKQKKNEFGGGVWTKKEIGSIFLEGAR